MINVKDMGAIGDGVADDTDAIKKCLAASLSVYFPPGDYKVKPTPGSGGTTALTIAPGIRSAGERNCRIIPSASRTALLRAQAPSKLKAIRLDRLSRTMSSNEISL
jgi:hypothetical protein